MSQARNSQASKLEPQDSPCLDFTLEPLAGLGGGPGGQGRGESPPCPGDWDRSTKDISARGGIIDTGVLMVSYVFLEYLCPKVRYGKTGAMDAERWRQRVLQLIYLSLPRHNRIGSHFCMYFCMYSCSPSSGTLDPRVDPIDRVFILGLDARETNPITSDCNSLSSTMLLLQCDGSHMQAAISFVSRVSSFCCLTRREEE